MVINLFTPDCWAYYRDSTPEKIQKGSVVNHVRIELDPASVIRVLVYWEYSQSGHENTGINPISTINAEV